MSIALRRMALSPFAIWMYFLIIGSYFLFPLRSSLRYGIDLVGGTYLTLEVQTEKAVEAALMEKMDSMSGKFKRAGKEAPVSEKIVNGAIVLEFSSMDAAQAASSILKEDDRDLVQTVDGSSITLRFSARAETRMKEDAVKRNIDVLRTRLDKFSVAEISISPKGERHIIVELPDVDDPQQAKAMIGTAAILEFKIVEAQGNSPEDILLEYDGDLPAGMEILPGKRNEGAAYYMVPKRSTVTGKSLQDARPNFVDGAMAVNFEFNAEGGEKFYELTSKNYGRQLAVVLDNVVITAPVINAAIRNSGVITGTFSSEQAKDLALLLKSGSLVVPVTFEEERQIGPSLGQESIKQGVMSCLIGFALVLLFSLYYYKFSGFLAFLALIYNVFLILVGMSWLNATLTLPGIGGIVLTIGMAIDASILIYERIKEELALGVSVKKAVDDGFSDAMRVILDANITTFIVGIVVYKFGTGPIQGFAITMMLGIISTIVTGLFFLRALFNFILDNFNIQKLKI